MCQTNYDYPCNMWSKYLALTTDKASDFDGLGVLENSGHFVGGGKSMKKTKEDYCQLHTLINQYKIY